MKKANKLIDVYVLTTLIFTIAAITLRTVAHFLDYNYATMHFNDKTLFSLSAWLIVAGIILTLTFFVVAKKKIELAASSDTPLTYIPSGTLTTALAFMAFSSLSEIGSFTGPTNSILRYLSIGISIFATAAAVFFFFNILNLKRESIYKSLLCIAVVVFLTLYAAFIYFNNALPTNAPVKVIDLMAYLFSAIFFVYETRITLGRAFWKPYIVFGLISAALCGYSAIPSIILYIVRGEVLSLSITESVLTLTLFIFAISRVFLTKHLPEMGRCKAATLASSYNESRNDHLAKFRQYCEAANAPAVTVTTDEPQTERELEIDDDSDFNQETINIDEYTVKTESSDTEDEETISEEE